MKFVARRTISLFTGDINNQGRRVQPKGRREKVQRGSSHILPRDHLGAGRELEVERDPNTGPDMGTEPGTAVGETNDRVTGKPSAHRNDTGH